VAVACNERLLRGRGRVPRASAERPLSVQSTDLRGNAGDRARSADSSRSRNEIWSAQVDPQPSFKIRRWRPRCVAWAARSPPLQSAARPRPAPRRPGPPHAPCRARGSTAAARALPWCNPPHESPRGLACLRSGDQRPRPEIHPVNQQVIATARTSEMAGRLLLGLDPLRWRF